MKTDRNLHSGRAVFTQEDDEILLNWLTRPGVGRLKGMKEYKELAERVCEPDHLLVNPALIHALKYPQHTAHSWRGRWVDKLTFLMPDGPKPRTKITFSNEDSADQQEETISRDVEFTREDDIILLKMKDEIIKAKDSKPIYERLHQQVFLLGFAVWKGPRS